MEFEVTAPDEQDENFTGNITVVNKDNSSDFCRISVSLATPVNYPFNIHPLLQMILERFPMLERILCLFPVFNRMLNMD